MIPTDFQPANVNQHVCIIRPVDIAISDWIAWTMKSSAIKSQIDYAQTGAGREGLHFEQIGSLALVIPSPVEVTVIATHLEKGTSRIDSLVTKTKKSIELLKERRSSLISATVTGKLDVG